MAVGIRRRELKTSYTKSDLQEIIEKYHSLDLETKVLPRNHNAYRILLYIETYLCEKVISDIRIRQNNLKKLKRDRTGFLAVWNGKRPPGCDHCLAQKWTQVRNSSKCNLDCPFCYHHGTGFLLLEKTRYHISGSGSPSLTLDEAKCNLARRVGNVTGAAWVSSEPLEEFQKIPELMKWLAELGYWQWLYTNGVRADEENLKTLSDFGLNEIRFNLQATKFSDTVIKRMALARKYFDYVCIETPMYKEVFENYKKKKQQILDAGVTHINSAELQIRRNTFDFGLKQGMLYRHRKGYTSPISSRQLTYDLIDMAEAENWNVVIHDCSNDTKFYRGCIKEGGLNYATHVGIPKASYLKTLEMMEFPVEIF